MEIIYKSKAIKDIEFWKKSGNNQIKKRITSLIQDIEKHPTIGLGKPEMLKHDLTGFWSREIDKKIVLFTK